jgi:putative ABC transport system permease protein
MQHSASYREALRVALDSLRSNKLRSFLTLLGIILATTTLIAVMSVIRGMDVYIAETVSTMGSDGFRVVRMAFMGNFDPKKFVELNRKNPQITAEEYEFVRRNATLAREVGLEINRGASVSYGNQTLNGTTVIGATANAGVITNTQLAAGRFVNEIDDQHRREVAVIGNDLKERFFPNVDPVGKRIEIAGRPFEVIGVAMSKGSVFGQSLDNFVNIPAGSFFKMYGSRRGISILAKARNQEVLEQAQDEVRGLLRAYRHLRPDQEDTFSLVSSEAMANAWKQLTGAIAAAAVAVVSVFLVVGGVVIMNIMLAVVTERTREIGIRKATGARRKDILNQFLVESSVLAGLGGLIGVGLAWGIAVIVRNATPVPMTVPATAVLVAVGLSSAVGLFFGIYPARRAAQLDPIVALRAES